MVVRACAQYRHLANERPHSTVGKAVELHGPGKIGREHHGMIHRVTHECWHGQAKVGGVPRLGSGGSVWMYSDGSLGDGDRVSDRGSVGLVVLVEYVRVTLDHDFDRGSDDILVTIRSRHHGDLVMSRHGWSAAHLDGLVLYREIVDVRCGDTVEGCGDTVQSVPLPNWLRGFGNSPHAVGLVKGHALNVIGGVVRTGPGWRYVQRVVIASVTPGRFLDVKRTRHARLKVRLHADYGGI